MFSLLIIGLVIFFLGLFVLIKDFKNKINIIFFFLSLSFSFWVISSTSADLINSYEGALFWARLAIVGPFFAAFFLLLFSYYFPVKDENIDFKKIILLFLPLVLVLFLVPTKFNVENIYIKDGWTDFTPGYLYTFLLFYILICYGWAFVRFKKIIKKSNRLVKLQIDNILLGIIFVAIIGVVTNLILPLLGYGRASVFGPASSLFFVAFTTYSIIRYRFFDIRIQTQKILNTILPVVLSLATIIIISGLAYKWIELQPHIVGSFLLLTGILLYETFRRLFTETKLRYFLFKKVHLFHKSLLDFSKEASNITDFEELVEKIKQMFLAQDIIKDFLFVVVTDQKEKTYYIGKHVNIDISKLDVFTETKIKDFFYNYLLKSKEPIVVDELLYRSAYLKRDKEQKNDKEFLNLEEKVKTVLEPLKGGVCLPLVISNELVGFIMLGAKNNFSPYTNEDIEVFDQISSSLAVALVKSMLFTQYKIKVKELERDKNVLEIDREELQKMKKEFLTIVDHQFNTPLSIIRGAFSMIEEGDVGISEVKAYVKDISPRIKEFQQIVDDMLEATHLEGTLAEMTFMPLDVKETIDEVISELTDFTEQHKATVTISYEDDLPRITSDKERFSLALRHLIKNAILYGDGKVDIKIKKVDKDFVEINIIDYGRGFEKEEKEHIGEKFYRGQDVNSYYANGSGLGIYNAKRVIKASGGEFSLESEGKGKGSIFTVKIPKGSNFFKNTKLT